MIGRTARKIQRAQELAIGRLLEKPIKAEVKMATIKSILTTGEGVFLLTRTNAFLSVDRVYNMNTDS